MSQSELIARIETFLKSDGTSTNSFAKLAGIDPGNMAKMLAGKQKITDNTLRKISQTHGISFEWLKHGEGDMLNETIEVEEVEKDEPQVGEEYLVPLVPVGAFAGSLSGFDIQGTDARNCELVVSPIPRMDWAVEVVGDSMESEYPNGSRVFVKKVNSAIFLEWGCVYVIDTDNGLVMKSIRPSRDPDCITCVSLNPRYAPFDVPKESIRAMYRVWACLTLK